MERPKFKDFDYGKGYKDISYMQYAKSLDEYIDHLHQKKRVQATQKVLTHKVSANCLISKLYVATS